MVWRACQPDLLAAAWPCLCRLCCREKRSKPTSGRRSRGLRRGVVTQLIEASPDRVAARCPYFQQCGGCHYQHIPYERQLEFKAGILRETVLRIAKIEMKSEIRLHASPPWNYRNRTRLQVRTAPEFALGYFRFGSREFLPVRECPISAPLINRVMARLLELGGLNCPAAVEEMELFADAADERLLAWAFCGREADKKDLSALGGNAPARDAGNHRRDVFLFAAPSRRK